jgi:hypothetical protein
MPATAGGRVFTCLFWPVSGTFPSIRRALRADFRCVA